VRKLEIGSGPRPTRGYTHLDINPNAPNVDIVGGAFPLPPEVHAATWDTIRAIDVLEHFSYRHTVDVLREWASVMRPGGRLYVQVPDAETIMRWFVHQPDRLPTPDGLPDHALAGAAWRLLGGHADGVIVGDGDDWRWNAHYALFSYDSLVAQLNLAGFTVTDVERSLHPNLLAMAVRR